MNNLRNEKLLVKFGLHVKKLREAKDMSQDDLAYACDMEKSQVYRIEKGKVNATISTLEALAGGLGISISELVMSL